MKAIFGGFEGTGALALRTEHEPIAQPLIVFGSANPQTGSYCMVAPSLNVR
jgi:hypothetical protein